MELSQGELEFFEYQVSAICSQSRTQDSLNEFGLHEMAPPSEARRYDLHELLSLRTSLPVVSCLVKNINKHPNIGTSHNHSISSTDEHWLTWYQPAGIFRIPEEALRRPEQFSCKSTHLADITNKLAPRQLGRKNITDSSEQSESQSLSDIRATQDQQVRWNLRRRDISDRSSQPRSAPTDLVAQQSENFQRFYRAVVSPTHVRVTAGGRIVPNTRSPAPPPPEWNSDKTGKEFDLNNVQPSSWLPNSALPTAYPPVVSSSFFPQPNTALSNMPLPTGLYGGDSGRSEDHQTTNNNGEMAAGSQLPGALPQPIKISPPNQFDQTKPFMYNGQIVYPVPHGFQPPPGTLPVPIAMLGNPNFFPQVSVPPPGYLPTPFLQFGNTPNPMMFAPGQQTPMMVMPNSAQPSGNPALTPFIPMPGVIAPADFMKSQIQVMQNHLKHIEHQLANNKHQIDEVMMEHQQGILLSQISGMEALLQVHLGQEGGATNGSRRDAKTSGSHEEQKPIRAVSHSWYQSLDAATQNAVNGDAKDATRAEPSYKSKLTIAAAMAPPFQPRSRTTVAHPAQAVQTKQISQSTSALEDAKPRETRAQIEARLMAKATTDWNKPGFTFGPAKGYATLSRTRTHHESSLQGQKNEQPPAFQRATTFNGCTLPVIANDSSQAVPYLIGVLPAGVNAQAASANDLVYSRPLTDDEVRARYLYWGKAPRSVQSGLPKFDGKDFYPPSPVKNDTRLAFSESDDSQLFEKMHFETLFTERGVPGYRSPSPPPPAHPVANGIPNLHPASQPVFSNSGDHSAFSQQASSVLQASRNSSRESSFIDKQKLPESLRNLPESAFNCKLSDVPELDFSQLFMERGVPGYRSPSPKIKQSIVRYNPTDDELPVTPENPTFFGGSDDEDDDIGSVDSWQQPSADSQRYNRKSAATPRSDTQDTESTVEIHLSPQNNGFNSKLNADKSFYDRVESSRG